jgi:AraC-like DNA-binding protein
MPLTEDGWTFQLVSMPVSLHTADATVEPVRHVSHDLHLIHTVQGKAVLRVQGQAYPTHPGVVLAVPVFEPHEWIKRPGVPWRMINLHVRLFEANGYAVHEQALLPVSFAPASIGKIHRGLERWQAQWRGGDWRVRSQVAGQVLGLVSGYLEKFARPQLPALVTDPLVEHMHEQIRRLPVGELDVSTLAEQAGLSVSQMNRRFRAVHGCTPKAIWQRHRLSTAQGLLRDTDMSVSQIALKLGFSDIYYFSRWFKNGAYASPLNYRRWSRSI